MYPREEDVQHAFLFAPVVMLRSSCSLAMSVKARQADDTTSASTQSMHSSMFAWSMILLIQHTCLQPWLAFSVVLAADWDFVLISITVPWEKKE